MKWVVHTNGHSSVNAVKSRSRVRSRSRWSSGVPDRLRGHPSLAGMTLIEIMVVVVIVAVAATGVSMGLGALTRTSLRSACVHMSSLARYAYHRALTQGTTVRLQMDMESGNFSLTEAHGRVTLVRSDSKLRQEAIHDLEQENRKN